MSHSPGSHHSLIPSLSRDDYAPLRHPTPDLQSLQGAYVGNVERLEESAERLSLNSNIGEELRKLHREQKRSESRKSSVQAASRQFSTSSFTNSILGVNSIARSGGFSPEGYVTSPVGSMLSPPWSHRSFHDQRSSNMDKHSTRSEPEQEGRPLDSPISPKSAVLGVTNPGLMESPEEEKEAFDFHETYNGVQGELERPASAGSGDTFQRATNAFADFDGVHIEADARHEIKSEPQELVEAIEQTSPHESPHNLVSPQPRDDMVFYPAPVPMMLNLPQKLSKAPNASKVAQRRQEVLAASSAKARKSVARPTDLYEGVAEPQSNSEAANDENSLPPQLRATMFFEHTPVHQDIQITRGSAVATLDTILDASAHAPVSAFTDHPIVGQAGAEIYGKSPNIRGPGRASAPKRKSRSSIQLLTRRKSSANVQKGEGHRCSTSLDTGEGITEESRVDTHGSPLGADTDASHEGTPLRQSMEHADQTEQEDEGAKVDDNDLDEGPDLEGEEFHERPTTLLAELQIRKQRQQRRNRTAATAFPNGMHSTLLELDAVAQVQERERKQKHVLLAWEDPDASHPADEDPDEDVPLGVLYPSSKPVQKDVGRFDDDRPLGLLAQRAMEDNEPLSQRRARLRGEHIRPSYTNHERSQSTFNLEVRGLSEDDREGDHPEEEEETLAQRLRRLRGEKPANNNRKSISEDFASEILSQFGGLEDKDPKADGNDAATLNKTPDPEETLGQRRARLQAERLTLTRNVSGEATMDEQQQQQRPVLQKRRSMADILQAHPVGARMQQPASQVAVPGISSSGLVGGIGNEWQASMTQRQTTDGLVSPHGGYQHRQGTHAAHAAATAVPYSQVPASYVNPMTYTPMTNTKSTTVTPGYPTMAPMADQMPLDRKQRDMIDRWRQSVM